MTTTDSAHAKARELLLGVAINACIKHLGGPPQADEIQTLEAVVDAQLGMFRARSVCVVDNDYEPIGSRLVLRSEVIPTAA